MEVEINLDALTERYVRNKEEMAAYYRSSAWVFAVMGLLFGFMFGMATGIRLAATMQPQEHVVAPSAASAPKDSTDSGGSTR